jgi:hypothetical protein
VGKRAILFFVLILGSLGLASSVHAVMHSYRYQLVKRCGLDECVGDLLGAPNVGQRFDVEEDAEGRRVRTVGFQDGLETAENRFKYSGDNKVLDGWAVIVHGKTNGIVTVTYGTDGCAKRMDFLTGDKQLTAYSTFEQRSSNRVEVLKYDSHNTLRSRQMMFYNEHDVLIGEKIGDPLGGAKYVEIRFDDATGMETSRKEFIGKQLQFRSECLYNEFGNVIARKDYNKEGQNTGGSDYSAGLMTNRWYAESGNHTLSFRYSYDENRWKKEAKVYQDQNLVCVLTYERMSNGAPKRTLAKSPGGELWAEYPDEEVLVIRPDGRLSHPTKATFYKTGPWW